MVCQQKKLVGIDGTCSRGTRRAGRGVRFGSRREQRGEKVALDDKKYDDEEWEDEKDEYENDEESWNDNEENEHQSEAELGN